jgi:hypothetical protein
MNPLVPSPLVSDYGPVLVIDCPYCQHPVLVLESTAFYFLFVRINISYVLKCQNEACRWHHEVPEEDRQDLVRLTPLCQAYLDGKLALDRWLAAVDAADLRVIGTLRVLTDEWECPSCGESSPIAFDACWQCQTPSPVPVETRMADVGRFALEDRDDASERIQRLQRNDPLTAISGLMADATDATSADPLADDQDV